MTSVTRLRVFRLLAVLLVASALAAACSDSDDGGGVSGPETGVTADPGADGSETDVGDGSDEVGEPDTPDGQRPTGTLDGVELIATTDVDTPFATDGGATSSDDGVIIDDDDPRANLLDPVRTGTDAFATDWTRRTVELDEFLLGIPALDPRDRIPPIDEPRFEPIQGAAWLDPREPGALVRLDDDVRFYPLSILTRHEIVNDRFGDVPVAVTYCPLCNTAVAFDARVDGERLRFGVSGLLRNSDLVMWDDRTETLWQQLTGDAVVGELAGTRLELISTAIVSYREASETFPDALALSTETGFGITYGSNSYGGYSSSSTPFLFDQEPDPRFPALSRVVGVSIPEGDKAYPFETLTEELVVNDTIGDVPVAVFWGGDTADALDSGRVADGQAIGTAPRLRPSARRPGADLHRQWRRHLHRRRDGHDVVAARRGHRRPADRFPALDRRPPQRVLVRLGRLLPPGPGLRRRLTADRVQPGVAEVPEV